MCPQQRSSSHPASSMGVHENAVMLVGSRHRPPSRPRPIAFVALSPFATVLGLEQDPGRLRSRWTQGIVWRGQVQVVEWIQVTQKIQAAEEARSGTCTDLRRRLPQCMSREGNSPLGS